MQQGPAENKEQPAQAAVLKAQPARQELTERMEQMAIPVRQEVRVQMVYRVQPDPPVLPVTRAIWVPQALVAGQQARLELTGHRDRREMTGLPVLRALPEQMV